MFIYIEREKETKQEYIYLAGRPNRQAICQQFARRSLFEQDKGRTLRNSGQKKAVLGHREILHC